MLDVLQGFVHELRAHRRGLPIAVVGNRVREGTLSADQLRQFVDLGMAHDIAVVTGVAEGPK